MNKIKKLSAMKFLASSHPKKFRLETTRRFDRVDYELWEYVKNNQAGAPMLVDGKPSRRWVWLRKDNVSLELKNSLFNFGNNENLHK